MHPRVCWKQHLGGSEEGAKAGTARGWGHWDVCTAGLLNHETTLKAVLPKESCKDSLAVPLVRNPPCDPGDTGSILIGTKIPHATAKQVGTLQLESPCLKDPESCN